jgi:zinc protease
VRRALGRIFWAACFLALAGCPASRPPEQPDKDKDVHEDDDRLGDRPDLHNAVPYKAPTPEIYTTAEGITVWLIERHTLPVVSLQLALPVGAAEDPQGKGGLAHITAAMLDEGAGSRGAIEISDTLADMGADMWTSVEHDGSRIALTVLKRHLDAAFGVFADVVARPKFLPDEFARIHKQWLTQLASRNDDVQSVASLVRMAVVYGADTPYGHPSSGLVETAKTIDLAAALDFYKKSWRPDRAILVAAGDITRAELDQLVATHLDDWKKPGTPAPPLAPAAKPLAKRPRLVLVDRPGAPQAVISVVGMGVAANDAKAPLLDLINTALGGSFTSRLNQNLREDHGWTYGARSSFSETRGVGAFAARAAVFTNVTAAALKETLTELDKMAEKGLTEDELAKVRAGDLTSMMETNETLDSLVGRLTSLAMLGLPFDQDARASEARQNAAKPELDALGKVFLDTKTMSIIVVGPRDEVLPQLKTLGLGEPEMWTVEGRPAKE